MFTRDWKCEHLTLYVTLCTNAEPPNVPNLLLFKEWTWKLKTKKKKVLKSVLVVGGLFIIGYN